MVRVQANVIVALTNKIRNNPVLLPLLNVFNAQSCEIRPT